MSVITRVAKRGAEGACLLLALPYGLIFELQARLFGRAYACIALSQHASRWSSMLGVYLRRALLRRMIARVGKDAHVGFGTIFTNPAAELGDSVYIGRYCIFGDIRVGDGTLIADQVRIITGQHTLDRLDLPIKDQPTQYRTLVIGADSWIGSGATLLADVGNHCVVGAGSVVTKPVPDFMIVAGNPARPIGDRRQRRVRP